MATKSGEALELLLAAAGERTRRRILLSFYDDPGPRTVDQVAAEAGVHRTVAFQHLERLARFGYLFTDRRRGQRGKPAKVYRLARGPIELSHPPRLHRQLAGLLAQSLARFGSEGSAVGRDRGREFGLALGQAAPGVLEALEPLESLGGHYVMERKGVLAAVNCVFREACAESPPVVCALHAGILEGTLEAAGHRHRVVPLGPRLRDGCAFTYDEVRAS